MFDIPMHIIHLDQDDPKKCTARAMERAGCAIVHENVRGAPRRGFLLDPSAGVILGPNDISLIERGAAIVGLDCSWKHLEPSIESILINTKLEPRTLPLVLPANPISWGKPGRLSTAEAMALCAAIMGRMEQAKRILKPFRFGQQFLELNAEPIATYQSCKTNAEVIEAQWIFFNQEINTTL
ncbi:MAG: Uncharacterised protein [Methanobacteriota archaeon]|nr:MAG: Uncharacterised protein [Euryarchaeota archaeon]